MRTVIAPADSVVRGQLEALDGQLRVVAEGYIARLRLEPYLGHELVRGLLWEVGARAVYFDRDSRPDALLSSHRGRLRVAGEDASSGPRYRVVYRALEARAADVRVVQVLAVGIGHAERGVSNAYELAELAVRRSAGQRAGRRRR